MKVILKNSFIKDIKKVNDNKVKSKLSKILSEIESTTKFNDINNLEKIKGYDKYYRIRVGIYRVGVFFDGEQLSLVRFLHRKDIYKYFPN
jgi:mRNA interferase RelE/StbE